MTDLFLVYKLMQRRLEDLYDIELALSLEAVNVKHLLQESEVCKVRQCLCRIVCEKFFFVEFCSLFSRKKYSEFSINCVQFFQNLLERSKDVKKKNPKDVPQHQKFLEDELNRVRGQLQNSNQILEEISHEQSRWEHEMLVLRQALQASASKDMQYGLQHSAETLHIEAELGHVQQKASSLAKKRNEMVFEIQKIVAKEEFLSNEIRPSPTGVAGAEPVPSRKKKSGSSWVETDMDRGHSVNRASEVESQLRLEAKAKEAGSTYVNAYDEQPHDYENYTNGNNDDDIQTVHSEGVRSEAPPLPAKVVNGSGFGNHDYGETSSSSEMYSLGDISEADDRVKKFYGLLPKNGGQQQNGAGGEIKTVRMVKRDSKERSVSKTSTNGDQQPPLPNRGNYQNVHDFLTAFNNNNNNATNKQEDKSPSALDQDEETIAYNQRASTLPRSYNSNDLSSVSYSNVIKPSMIHGGLPRSNFKLGEYNRYKKKVK